MKNFSQYSLCLIITMMVFFIPGMVHAQFDPGGGPDIPVDGGLSLLLGAGVSYVVKKGYDARKKNKASQNTEN